MSQLTALTALLAALRVALDDPYSTILDRLSALPESTDPTKESLDAEALVIANVALGEALFALTTGSERLKAVANRNCARAH